MIKAYKGFHKDLTCTMGKGVYKYREHEWLEEQEANCARNGFHCCYNPLDCLRYYHDFKESAYYLVYADGDIHEDGADTRIACTKIRLEKRLSTEAFVAHALLYMAEHPYLETSSIVMNETVHGEARNGFWLVRGKNPKCSAPIGTVVGMAQEAANSREIISMTVYKVNGEEYKPDAVYLVDGREMAP